MVKAFPRSRMFSFEVRATSLQKAFAKGPDIAFRHAQDYADHMVRSFRKLWLSETQVDFDHPERIAPVRHSIPGSTKSKQAHKQVYFVVRPSRRQGRGRRTLSDIKVDVFTVSQSWESLEEGAHIRPKGRGKLIIPIGITLDKNGNRKGAWSTPAKFTRANKKGDKRVLIPVKKKGWKATILYWKKPKRSVRSKRGSGKKKRYALIPAFMLVDHAKLPRLMSFYDSWDKHAPRRRAAGREMLTEITRDLAKDGGRG